MKKRHYDESELVKYLQREPRIKNYFNKEMLIHLDSFCLGDTICFFSFIKGFLEFHKPSKVFITTFFPELFELTDEYPNVEILPAYDSTKKITIDKIINVGYDKKNLQHTINGMFYSAKDTLEIPQCFAPVKPPVKKINVEKIKNKVSIGPETVKKIAAWDHYGNYGWQRVVDFLVKNNYQVYNISYEDKIKLNNVFNSNKKEDLKVAIEHILSSQIFIGLSSGLSWLAWAYDVPVVMISGFTKPHNEFECYRVFNKHGCSGCFNIFTNIESKCPIFLNTSRENECHKRITPEMVICEVKKALTDLDDQLTFQD